MEMENSRRTFDRSREPGLKKLRLTQDPTLTQDRTSNGRATFMHRPATSGSIGSRKLSERAGDSESSDSVRGPYPHIQHQHLELVNQYKTALAELTFNSKPIITNLTIIAGENLHVAKAIAATVCSNVLEVPSEQKLPSLYLLDSIVKNIGRDYIKYFGSRLPEVFCKAYRQVDPSIHPGMRHLFGTWKGVFPPQPLQTIEKELGFAVSVNRVPSGATSQPAAPVSRPARSIHVNPKYLEARQRLQQSSKNSQHTERELSNVLHAKNISAQFGDMEYDSDVSKPAGLVTTQAVEKFSGNARGSLSTQRNGIDVKHGVQNYPLNTKRQPNHALTSQSTISLTGSWKNSEEEEYMWDDINSRVGDQDHAASSARDRWSLDDSEKMSEASADSLCTEIKDTAIFGNRGSSPWSQESPLPEKMRSLAGRTIPGHSGSYPIPSGGFATSASGDGRMSFQSKVPIGGIGTSGYVPSNSPTLGSTVSVVPQRQTLGAASPSAQSLQYSPDSSSSFAGHGGHPVLQNISEQESPHARIPTESRTSQFSGSLNIDALTKFGQESLPFSSRSIHLPNQKVISPNIPSSFSSTPPQLRQHTFSQQLDSEHLVSDFPHQSQNPHSHSSSSSFHDDPNLLPLPSSGQTSSTSLLAAVSGILKNNSIAGSFSHQSSKTPVALSSPANSLPTLSSGPPRSQLTTFTLGMSMSSLSSQSAQSILTQKNVDGPPLPTCLVSTDISSSTLTESANVTNANMPVSSLLSSLVAKGFISATKTDSTSNPSQTLSQPDNCSSETTRSDSSQVSLPLASLPLSSSYTINEPSAQAVSASTDTHSSIGFQFKGDVLRVLHPAVISQLFDDFPYKCGICEGRLKIEDQVGRHSEWHALRNRKSNSSKASRVWYADSVNILSADAGTFSVNKTSCPQEGLITKPECSPPMVPADESQCLCILCGELFEDFYDQGMAQWMFKGAVYANVPCSDATTGNRSEVVAQGSIVHEKCISNSDA